MKKIIVTVFMLLTGCGHPSFDSVKTDEFAAVLTIKEPGLTFVNPQGSIFAEWSFDELYTGGVLFDDNILLYGSELDHAVLYSIKTGEKTGEWTVPSGITAASFIDETNEIAFSVKKDGAVHFFNSSGTETKSTKTGRYPMSMLEHAGNLYVINYQDTVLSEIDVHTHNVTREFAIPTSSTGLAVKELSNEIWVGGHGYGAEASDTIHVYSLETGSLAATADAPVMPIAFAEKNGYMYTASHGSSTLYAFDPDRKRIAETEAPANPFAVALFGNHLISAGYDSGTLSFHKEETLEKTKTVEIGKGPFMIFVKEGE